MRIEKMLSMFDEEKLKAAPMECGAKLAEEVFFDDSRTMFDQAGHPFCLDTFHG